MLDLPNIVLYLIEEMRCPHCNDKMKAECVSSVGIKKSEKFRNRSVLFFQYDCLACNNSSIISANRMTVEEFVMDVFEEYTEEGKEEQENTEATSSSEEEDSEDSSLKESKKNKKQPKKNKNANAKKDKKSSSMISDEEVSSFKKRLDNYSSFQEFLNDIGVDESDLKKYSKENEDNDK